MRYLDIIIALDFEVEGALEGDILLRHGLDIDLLHHTGTGHDLLPEYLVYIEHQANEDGPKLFL